MKNKLKLTLIITVAIILIVAVLSSCKTSRQFSSVTNNSDSLEIAIKSDSIRFLTLELFKVTEKIKELESTGVTFDPTKCPDIPEIPIPVNCDADSLKAALTKANSLIAKLNAYNQNLSNKVKIYADGTIEYEGKISAANYTKSKQQEYITEQRREIDSLKKVIVSTLSQNSQSDETVNKTSKTKVGVPLLLFALCFVGGAFSWAYFGQRIKLFLNPLKKIV